MKNYTKPAVVITQINSTSIITLSSTATMTKSQLQSNRKNAAALGLGLNS